MDETDTISWYEERMATIGNPPPAVDEWIVAAAIRVRDVICFVPKPGRHADIFYAMSRAGFEDRIGPEAQGFVTNSGRFVGREEARQIADRQNQLIKGDVGKDGVPFVRQSSQLFSEDVW